MGKLVIDDPNTDRSLLTIAELRAIAGVSDSSRDAELTALGNYLSSVITRTCNVAVAATGAIPPTLRLETVEETYRVGGGVWPTSQPTGKQSLALSRRPVVAISSIFENNTELAGTDYEVQNNLLYRLSSNKRVCWPAGDIVVTYSAGWATVPDDLKYAVMRLTSAQLQDADRDPLLKRKVTEGVSEYEWWVDPTRAQSVVSPAIISMLDDGGYIRKWGWMD